VLELVGALGRSRNKEIKMDKPTIGDLVLHKGTYNDFQTAEEKEFEDIGIIVEINEFWAGCTGEQLQELTVYWLKSEDSSIINTEDEIIYDPKESFSEWVDPVTDTSTIQKLR
jgi:hypothetical protein